MASTGKMQGKVALVTGGSGGIGGEVCVSLAGQGASIVVVDLVPADELTTKIAAGGGKAIYAKADVSKSADVKAAFDKAVEVFGAVHIVVHCAGIMLNDDLPIQSTSEESWDFTFLVIARGTFLVTKEATNRLGPGGRIVVTSSSLAQNPVPCFGPYSCAKASIECLVRTVAKELMGRKITINGVAPGPVKTPMLMANVQEPMLDALVKTTPLGRLGETTDIARLIHFLVSDEGEWVNGTIIPVSGGFS